MKRVAVCAAVGAVMCFGTVAIAQDTEVSSLDIKKANVTFETRPSNAADHRYVADISGKQVRLVGPRFFPDNSKEVALFGRDQALAREQARSQIAAK